MKRVEEMSEEEVRALLSKLYRLRASRLDRLENMIVGGETIDLAAIEAEMEKLLGEPKVDAEAAEIMHQLEAAARRLVMVKRAKGEDITFEEVMAAIKFIGRSVRGDGGGSSP